MASRDKILYEQLNISNKEANDVSYYDLFQDNETALTQLRTVMKPFRVPSGRPESNVVEMGKNCYAIPPESLPIFFHHLEMCRSQTGCIRFNEKQLASSSGIVLDLDIYQSEEKSYLNNDRCSTMAVNIVNSLMGYFDLSPYRNEKGDIDLIVGVIQKPKVVFDDTHNAFKDGVHFLIPSVQISRPEKRFWIEKLVDDKTLNDELESIPLVEGWSAESCIDPNSSMICPFFIGCNSKPGSPPYRFAFAFKITMKKMKNGMYSSNVDRVTSQFQQDEVFLTWEFSLNWEVAAKSAIIKKHQTAALPTFADDVAKFRNKKGGAPGDESSDLNALIMSDNEAFTVHEMVKILHPARAIKYNEWFQVLCLIAKLNPAYKPIARIFSQKIPEKYDDAMFNKYWDMALSSSTYNKNDIGLLMSFAETDNLIQYRQIQSNSTYSYIRDQVNCDVMNGRLEHNQLAIILHMHFKHKFVYDQTTTKWYRFVTPEDDPSEGEVYKWAEEGFSPLMLTKYVVNDVKQLLHKQINLMRKSFEKIREESDDEGKSPRITRFKILLNNLMLTVRDTQKNQTSEQVIKMSKYLFSRRNFYNILDVDPSVANIIGVGNGILLLDKRVRLIQTFHQYPISRRTTVDYIPYDPYNPYVKEVYMRIADMFIPEEMDSCEFLLYFLASALDFNIKDSCVLFMIGTGSNGKSTLLELIIRVFGSVEELGYANKISSTYWTLASNNSGAADPEKMSMQLARIIYSSEFEQNSILKMSKVKEATSAELTRARPLYGNGTTFTIKSMFILMSNYLFEIQGNDEGTWRRILLMNIRINFKLEKDYDANNKYHRLADTKMNKEWFNIPEIKSAALSILTNMYEDLQENYGGCVLNVPCPTIRRDTQQYRNEQDKVNKFITMRVVRTKDPTVEIPWEVLVAKYVNWFLQTYKVSVDPSEADKALRSSKLISHFGKNMHRDDVLRGHRILDAQTVAQEGDTFYSDQKADDIASERPPETKEEFYLRKCREHDLKKEADKAEAKEKRRQHRTELKGQFPSNFKDKMTNTSLFEKYGRVPVSLKKQYKSAAEEKDDAGVDSDGWMFRRDELTQ